MLTTTPRKVRGRASDHQDGTTTRAPRNDLVDKARGLAILAMLVDHSCVVFNGPGELRWTVGRLAMPLFFVIAGYVATRLSWRTAGVAVVGLLLPALAPWIDVPNVLFWWAVAITLIVLSRRVSRAGPAWIGVAVLGIAGNGMVNGGGGYPPVALIGLVALGAVMRDSGWTDAMFRWAAPLPRWVAAIGRAPLTWYVGHVLFLQAVTGMAVNHGR